MPQKTKIEDPLLQDILEISADPLDAFSTFFYSACIAFRFCDVYFCQEFEGYNLKTTPSSSTPCDIANLEVKTVGFVVPCFHVCMYLFLPA